MNARRWLSSIGSLLLLGSGLLLVLGNPSSQDYERYATDSLSFYLKDEVCSQAGVSLGGLAQSYCKTLVDTSKPQIQNIVSHTTTRRNYLLFSTYATKLSLPDPVPSYEFQTIGVMQQFYTYTADRL
ncbi:MAG: DUF4359 domain-containing protein [Microcystaceae cyanobacterium]|nr:DUF4359 domain-containing protein [Merismopediaceae bacterium]